VNIDIKTAEKTTVIGANGSGKSTLLHMLGGLIFPETGVVRAFGEALKESAFDDESFSRNFRRRVGLVFQNPDVQLFCPTVKEDILFGPLQLAMDKSVIEKNLADTVNTLKIGDLLQRSPHQLSVGEKRKVAIASVLLIDPDVLILDEPTAGLDPLTTRNIIDFLIKANASGKTVITATHDLHIVEEISDVVHVFSQDRKIVRSGRPEEILKDSVLLESNNLTHIHAHRHGDRTHMHPHQHLEHH
jgi:cobalt/nickel transport system ATP-binding protein